MSFGKIVRGRKFQQVLDGTRTVFLRDGFEGASVDAIAQEAGVSKATLYSYFSEKRVMLIEVARVEFERLADSVRSEVDLNLPTQELLESIAVVIAESVASDFSVQVFRLAVAETPRFPALGREYFRAGPGLLTDRIIMLLQYLTARGELQIDDIPLAAYQFAELCTTKIHDLYQLGMGDQLTPEEIRRIAISGARLFLRGYAPR